MVTVLRSLRVQEMYGCSNISAIPGRAPVVRHGMEICPERTSWVIDYSTANPPPATDLSAYATQQWVLQNFVQNIRVSAPQERKFWDGNGWSGNDSAFATAIWMVGGSSNVGGLYVRYVQKNINGTSD